MQRHLFPQALTILSILCFCATSSAEKQLLTEFQIQLDDSIGHSNSPLLTEMYKGKDTSQLDNMPVESQYPTWMEGVVMELDYEMSPFKPWQFGQAQDMVTTDLKININIGKVKTEFTETRREGGVVMTLDFHAECLNLPLKLVKSGAKFTASITPINKGSKVVLQLNDSKMTWPKDSWQAGALNCTGVKGYEKVLAEEMQNYLQNPEKLQSQIHEEFKKRVAQWEKQLNESLFQKSYIQEDVANYLSFLMPKQLMNTDATEEFHMEGHFYNVYGNIKGDNKNGEMVKFRTKPPAMKYQNGATFAFPVQSLPMMVKNFAKNGNISEKFTSDELDGFREYMSSSYEREYTWPDLLRYGPQHQFKFEMTVLDNPELYSLTKTDSGLRGSLRGTMVIHMFAPINGKYWPYTEWTVPFNAQVFFTLRNGTLTAQLGPGNYSWSAKFVPLYVRKFRPSSLKIDAKTIGEKLVENMRKKVMRWQLPLWKMTQKAQFKAEGMQTTNDHLLVFWDLQK